EMSMAMSMENALDQQHSGESHTALLRERFDFAAAHRLHVPTLSDDENRAIFGKCNNPSGHGHNYQIEPCVELDTAALADVPFGFAELERATHEQVITPFDHKHLNTDTPEFGEAGVNPSVENMARVFFDRLAPAVRRASAAATLRSITVWETDRTSCTYPA
ncbi:MAG: 6-carboxytetrahydropterin synthase, partial [Planctomycetota bacterium]